MIQLIGLLLCIYLVFKGLEIFQIGLSSTRENRQPMVLIGLAALVVSILVGGWFALILWYSGPNMPSSLP